MNVEMDEECIPVKGEMWITKSASGEVENCYIEHIFDVNQRTYIVFIADNAYPDLRSLDSFLVYYCRKSSKIVEQQKPEVAVSTHSDFTNWPSSNWLATDV